MHAKDIELLRPLAERYARLALSPRMRELEKRCIAHNSLEITRPLVNVFEVPWGELADDPALKPQCVEPRARNMETRLRQTLYQSEHFMADLTLPPYFSVTPSILGAGYGISRDEVTIDSESGSSIKSHSYHDMIPDIASLERIRMPRLSIDEPNTAADFELAEAVFKDIMPVRRGGVTLYSAMWDEIPALHGASKTIEDLIDNPEYCHAAIERFTQYFECLHREYERINVLEARPYYLHCTPALTAELPAPGFDGEHVRLKDVWGRGMAQIFTAVSPAMHDEFDLQYMQRLFDMCGLSYYGCCEQLDVKIPLLRKRFKNLRKVSISPWADKRRAAAELGPELIMSCKPNPGLVATGCHIAGVRDEFETALSACRESHTPCEFILKDISTIHRDPTALTDWVATANRAIDKYF